MILLALALAQANPYAKYAPARLIIIPPGQPALTIDYTTMERCQRARAELIRQDRETAPNAEETAKQLGRPVIIQHLTAYCVPG